MEISLKNIPKTLSLKKLTLKQKIIYTWRIWFGMKVELKVKYNEERGKYNAN